MRLPFDEMLAHLREHGEPTDPRDDIDTESLRRRFPRLAAVETSELSFEGARGVLPARLYRDPSAPVSGRGFVWVHGGAFVGGHLDMPESHWVALELASRGIPVLTLDYTKCLGDAHFPVRPTTCSPGGASRSTTPESSSGWGRMPWLWVARVRAATWSSAWRRG